MLYQGPCNLELGQSLIGTGQFDPTTFDELEPPEYVQDAAKFDCSLARSLCVQITEGIAHDAPIEEIAALSTRLYGLLDVSR